MLKEPRVLNRPLSALKTAKVCLTATKPRTNAHVTSSVKPQTEIPEFLNRLSETQCRCSLGDPFENCLGGGTVGVGCAGF